MILLLFFYFAEDAKPAAFDGTNTIITILLLIVTNAVNYYFNRPKSESEILRNYSEIIKANLETIDKYQKTHSEIYSKVELLQKDSWTKTEKLQELEELLELSQAELGDCLNKKRPCHEWKPAIEHSLEFFEKVKTYFAGSAEHAPILEEITVLIEVNKKLVDIPT